MHIEALACQLLGELYVERSLDDLADFYIGRAARLYERWGAHALTARLQGLHPARLQRAQTAPVTRAGPARPHTATTQTVGTSGEALDFGSVMKSVATLTGEIELDKLIEQVMAIVLENAGADVGALILDHDGTLEVVASQALEESAARIKAGPIGSGTRFPASISDYVVRTRHSVVLQDACGSELFHKDAYIAAHKPRSVLCAPLLKQGELVGLIYLENNLAPGAFTPDRVSVVDTLCGQAAVSIENARLYEHQKRMAESFSRFVPRQFIHHLGKRSLLDVGLGDSVKGEISVLFSDLRGFTSLSEQLGAEESFALLNQYLARMGPCITANEGFVDKYIGDAVMALFPRCADDAVLAALAMQSALRQFNEDQRGTGSESLTMGIGVHTGPMMLGTVGSELRMETTAIGDTVNLGSRIEGMTKMVGAGVLITEDTRRALSGGFDAAMRMVGRVRVQGKLEPTTVYEVIDGRMAFEATVKRVGGDGLRWNALPVQHLARVTRDGNPVIHARWPAELVFTPVPETQVSSEVEPDYRIKLQAIPAGSTLYEVSAREVEGGGEMTPIGRIVTRSAFIASRWGDGRIFFQHDRGEPLDS